ncbi:MAG: diaminopimelate decarboxylase [Chloroflexota bacterium]
MVEQISRLPLFPLNTEINKRGHLIIGGCDTTELAKEFGTPLYLFDELTLRDKCYETKVEFTNRYSETTVIYACKAFINKALLLLMEEEGMGLDVVSGGEIGFARSVNYPMDKLYFHGNNKSAEEIGLALDSGVGHIVVDNFYELELVGKIAKNKGVKPNILLRLTPGVDPHTHKYDTTGNIDSKFGFPLVFGEEAIIKAMSIPSLNLVGLHFHIGSQILETEPYIQAVEHILKFAADMKHKHGFEPVELSTGGGFAAQYTVDEPAPPVAIYAEAITSEIISECQELKLTPPRLIIEPGRSMVERAGVAIYTIGAIKEIPGVRTYASVDGGMGDNIRQALYQAKQEAVVANKMKEKMTAKYTIAGKFCESGDILIWDLDLPVLSAGDILAVAGCGAYCIPQSCNYNAFFKPAVVMVKDDKARLIKRRETLEDLMRCDVI